LLAAFRAKGLLQKAVERPFRRKREENIYYQPSHYQLNAVAS
jgi:hypothetical protein